MVELSLLHFRAFSSKDRFLSGGFCHINDDDSRDKFLSRDNGDLALPTSCLRDKASTLSLSQSLPEESGLFRDQQPQDPKHHVDLVAVYPKSFHGLSSCCHITLTCYCLSLD